MRPPTDQAQFLPTNFIMNVRTVACQACHNAKTKCQGHHRRAPCERCSKFQIACVPHTSRQGQGKRRKKAQQQTRSPSAEDVLSSPSEDALVLQQLDAQQRDHYGLRYLIHSWMSIAVRRRNFGLLSRASKLAAQLEISMDEIFSSRLEFLPDILLTPAQHQIVRPDADLHWEDIPERLLRVTGSSSNSRRNAVHRNDRWIWIREMNRGMSRYLISEAFARDIAPLQLLQETWERNEQSVVDLFVSPRCKHTQAFAHQISLFQNEHKQPECSRLNQMELQTQSQGTVPVDQIACLDIVDMNCSYYFLEYVPLSASLSQQNPSNPNAYVNFDFTFVDLDELLRTGDDAELQLFLKLMQEE